MARPILLLALLLLSACGGPRGDWRAEVGRTTPNTRVATLLPPLAIPPTNALPVPTAPPAAR